MRNVLILALAGLTFSQSAVAAVKPLEQLCQQVKMKPHTIVRTSLGPGSVYKKTGDFVPTTQNLLCADVFDVLPNAAATQVSDTAYIGELRGTSQSAGSLGLDLLAGLLGPTNKAKLQASRQRGDSWEVTSGPLTVEGQNKLGVMRFIAADSKCFSDIRALLGNKKSMSVLVVPQGVRATSLKYKYEQSSQGGAGAGLDLGSLVSISGKYDVKKTGSAALELSGPSINLCWSKPTEFKLQPDNNISPRGFKLTPVV